MRARPAPTPPSTPTTTTPAAAAASPAAAANASQPHLIFIMVDDFGWANVGFHAKGQPNEAEIVTPNMDALAASGIILDRHYAFRFCSPSRSSFLMGRNPIHVNVGNDQLTLVNPQDPVSGFAGIPRNMTSIAQKLKNAGYSTAQASVAGGGVDLALLASAWGGPCVCCALASPRARLRCWGRGVARQLGGRAGWARRGRCEALPLGSRLPRCRRYHPSTHPTHHPPPPPPSPPQAGKWHLGLATPDHTPKGRGFDTSLTYLSGANDYWTSQTTGYCDPTAYTDLWLHEKPAYGLNNSLACAQTNQPASCVYEDDIFTNFTVSTIMAHDPATPLFF